MKGRFQLMQKNAQTVEKKETDQDFVDSYDNVGAIIKDMHANASYTGEALIAKNKEKARANNLRKKNKRNGIKSKANQSSDLTERKSKAHELQKELNNYSGGNKIMEKRNQNTNIVGEAFEPSRVEKIIGRREQFVFPKNQEFMVKKVGLDAKQKLQIESEYALLAGNVRSYDESRICTLDEYLAYINTSCALIVNWSTTGDWKMSHASDAEEGKEIKGHYKDVSDQLIVLPGLHHAANQFGRYTNSDWGIVVDAIWCDFTDIGILSPFKMRAVLSKVENLYTLNGIKVEKGFIAKKACNPEVMTTYDIDVYGATRYNHFFRYINIAELLHTSRFRKDNFELKMDANATESEKAIAQKRVQERFFTPYTSALTREELETYNYELLKDMRKDV